MNAPALKTADAYPLGKPEDRDRYGMTQEQAYVYNWLVKHRPHNRPFAISFRELSNAMICGIGNAHDRVAALVERGWLERDDAGYKFVHPVMQFRKAR